MGKSINHLLISRESVRELRVVCGDYELGAFNCSIGDDKRSRLLMANTDCLFEVHSISRPTIVYMPNLAKGGGGSIGTTTRKLAVGKCGARI